DDIKNDVFRINALGQGPVEFEEHRLGYFEPELASCQRRGQIGRADAGGEGAEGAHRRRMRIAADYGHAWQYVALFGCDGVANAVIADLVIALDALFDPPLAQLFREFGALDVFVRNEVIRRDEDLRRIENSLDSEFLQHLHGGGRRDIVADDQIQLNIYD